MLSTILMPRANCIAVCAIALCQRSETVQEELSHEGVNAGPHSLTLYPELDPR
jgi:hypothetical protein